MKTLLASFLLLVSVPVYAAGPDLAALRCAEAARAAAEAGAAAEDSAIASAHLSPLRPRWSDPWAPGGAYEMQAESDARDREFLRALLE